MYTKVIQIDMDGVLVNFFAGFSDLSFRLFGKRPTIVRDWHWANEYLTKEEQDEIWKHIRASSSFWYHLPTLLVASERVALQDLDKKYRVYFVTARDGFQVRKQTEDWLRENIGIENPTVIITKFKGDAAKAIGADYALDDKPENAWCMSWLSPDTKSYLLDGPHNRYRGLVGSHKTIRIKTVGGFIRIINAETEKENV